MKGWNKGNILLGWHRIIQIIPISTTIIAWLKDKKSLKQYSEKVIALALIERIPEGQINTICNKENSNQNLDVEKIIDLHKEELTVKTQVVCLCLDENGIFYIPQLEEDFSSFAISER